MAGHVLADRGAGVDVWQSGQFEFVFAAGDGGDVGLTQAQLSRIENGRAPEELTKLIRYAQILGISSRTAVVRPARRDA